MLADDGPDDGVPLGLDDGSERGLLLGSTLKNDGNALGIELGKTIG